MSKRLTPTPEQLVKKATLLRERADRLEHDARAALWDQTFPSTKSPRAGSPLYSVVLVVQSKYVESRWCRFIPQTASEGVQYRALTKLGYFEEHVRIFYGDYELWCGPKAEVPKRGRILDLACEHSNGDEVDEELIFKGSFFMLLIKDLR